eukprot:5710502-Pleurochrysis_carterae.AAC.1
MTARRVVDPPSSSLRKLRMRADTLPNVKDQGEPQRPTDVAGARNVKDLWPLVSLITNVMYMTAAVTAGVMHVWAKDH